MKRRRRMDEFDRRKLTDDLAAAWLPAEPEPLRPDPLPSISTEAELLAAVGRLGLEFTATIRTRRNVA